MPAYFIPIDQLVAQLDRAIRGGQLQPHLVVRALDECGFPYDPLKRAFYVRSEMVPTMREEEQRIFEEKLHADTGKVDAGLLRGVGRTYTGPGEAAAGQPMNRLADGGNGADYSRNSGTRAMPARDVLRQRAFELRRKAAQIDALASAIPENFPSDANAALMELASSIHTF